MSDQLPCPGIGEWASTSRLRGPGSAGTKRSYSPMIMLGSTWPSVMLVPSRNHEEASVTVMLATAPTDWYVEPIMSDSGLFTGAWFQLTVVRAGSWVAIGSSVAS